MTTEDLEALQLALLQELNDIDGVYGIASTGEGEEMVFLIHVSDDVKTQVQERLDDIPELPPWKVVST